MVKQVCRVCNRKRDCTNWDNVCIGCWWANKMFKDLGIRPYYDTWMKDKTIDGVEYE